MFAARANGYIASKKYNEAIKDLEEAIKSSPQESFENNMFAAKLKVSSSEDDQQKNLNDFLEQIQDKSKHYIINVIKHLKAINHPQQIITCCEVLESQGNKSTFAQIELAIAHLKLGQVDQADQTISNISRSSNLTPAIRERLDRKKTYAQMRISAKAENYADAASHCQDLLGKKKSASAYYSLACLQFKEDKLTEAMESVTEALKLKPNK
jgi:tetratricopeptide (TPR) repeat protein